MCNENDASIAELILNLYPGERHLNKFRILDEAYTACEKSYSMPLDRDELYEKIFIFSDNSKVRVVMDELASSIIYMGTL